MTKKQIDEVGAKEKFRFSSSFGKDKLPVQEKNDLSVEELKETLEEKTILELRKEEVRREGLHKSKGRPKDEDFEDFKRMTFIVRKEYLTKIRLIGVRDAVFTKEIIDEALRMYLDQYERNYGKIEI